MPNKPFQRGDLIGHPFRDPGLLRQALTHRSAGTPNNERLEFLGDSIVNMLVAQALFERWPKADEGAMTRGRADLVREPALAVIARTLQLGDRLILGAGELKTGGHRRDSTLADALEAVVGAIYLDAGFEACRAVVLPWFEPSIQALPANGRTGKDPKTRLQEWLQGRQKPLPQYELLSEVGEDHAKTFHVRCNLNDPAVATEGTGASRRLAEQLAAAAALELLVELK